MPEPEEPPTATDTLAIPEALRERVGQVLPDARFTDHVTAEAGGAATMTWRSVRVRIPYGERTGGGMSREALESVVLLQELADAAAALARTSRWILTASGDALRCEESYEDGASSVLCRTVPEPEVAEPASRASGEPTQSMLPPSRRRRAAPLRPSYPDRWPLATNPAAMQIAEVLGRHIDLTVTGAPLDDAHRLLFVGSREFPSHGLLCITRPPPALLAFDCTPNEMIRSEGVVSERDSGWILAAEFPGGSPRDYVRSLVSLVQTDQGLVVDGLGIGGFSGDGEACQSHPGYCVYYQGTASTARMLTPECVEIRRGDSWTATRVRVQRRWIGEAIERGDQCIERFEISGTEFRRSNCGPPTTDDVCPDDQQ